MEVAYNVSRVSPNSVGGKFIIDTGATASISSSKWLKKHLEWLENKGQQQSKWSVSKKPFRFGNTTTDTCQAVVTTPVAVGGEWRMLKVHIFDKDVPNLLSMNGIMAIGGVLDLPNKSILLKKGNKIILEQKLNGLLCIDFHEEIPVGKKENNSEIIAFLEKSSGEGRINKCEEEEEEEEKPELECERISEEYCDGKDEENEENIQAVWEKMPMRTQEIFTAIQLSEFKKASGNKLYQIIKSIHEKWGHLSASQMRKQLAFIEDLPSETRETIKRVTDECEVCLKFGQQPGFPSAATGKSTHKFNEHLEMDLLFHGEWTFLHIADAHTHYNMMKILSSKKSKEVLDAFQDCWLLPFGVPAHITLDSGGEFIGEEYCEALENYGITPHYKAQGSHAFLIEQMHGPIRKTLLKINEANEGWSPERILVDVLKVTNNTVGIGGFTPSQAVFGHTMTDIASTLLGAEDQRQTDFFIQNTSPYGLLAQSMKLREMATNELQKAMNEQRLRRLLSHNNQYKNYKARIGDVVAFWKDQGGKDVKKTEAHWHGPADLIYLDGPSAYVRFQGIIHHIPLHKLRIWRPKNENDNSAGLGNANCEPSKQANNELETQEKEEEEKIRKEEEEYEAKGILNIPSDFNELQKVARKAGSNFSGGAVKRQVLEKFLIKKRSEENGKRIRDANEVNEEMQNKFKQMKREIKKEKLSMMEQ